MKVFTAGLFDSITGVYDPAKTTIKGRMQQKVINTVPCLGTPMTTFTDVYTDTGLAPLGSLYVTTKGRMIVLLAAAAGVATVALYDFDFLTGLSTFRGKINFAIPNSAVTTHTVRGLRLVDGAGVTGWKIFLATTGNVAINGGLFMVNKVDKADFSISSPPTIAFATGNDQKAVYFLQNPAAIGAGNIETTINGIIYEESTSRMWSHNGVSATHQYYSRDLTVAPAWTSASVTVTVAAPGKVQYSSHPYLTNDPVIFTAGTLPTGLSLNTVYFVRNPGVNDFEVSATSGGGSITTTGSPGSATIGRAFGTTSSMWLFKTGNLPALSGTLLTADSEKNAVPIDSPINGGVLNGNSCSFFATTTNLYLGLLSELSSGVTAWASLSTSNVLGGATETTVPTPTFASWGNYVDSCVYVTNGSKIIIKKLENNVIRANFGGVSNDYYEGIVLVGIELGMATVINVATSTGWMFLAGGTAGQRGIIAMDIYSDTQYDYSYFITKVMNTPNTTARMIGRFDQLFDYTGELDSFYRCSGFGSETGGWTLLDRGVDLNLPLGPQTQFKCRPIIESQNFSNGVQTSLFGFAGDSGSDLSDYLEYSHDHSSTTVPVIASFRIKLAFPYPIVPPLYFRAYDLTDVLVVSHNTLADPTYFEYSSDDGVSWSPLGTIPNVAGTLIRYNFASPPGVKLRPALREF